MKKTIEAVAGMICITAIELYAISQGIDGSILSVVVGILAGLGGYTLGKKTENT